MLQGLSQTAVHGSAEMWRTNFAARTLPPQRPRHLGWHHPLAPNWLDSGPGDDVRHRVVRAGLRDIDILPWPVLDDGVAVAGAALGDDGRRVRRPHVL
jgi:hypothetical protein